MFDPQMLIGRQITDRLGKIKTRRPKRTHPNTTPAPGHQFRAIIVLHIGLSWYFISGLLLHIKEKGVAVQWSHTTAAEFQMLAHGVKTTGLCMNMKTEKWARTSLPE
ncbi:hypothetical protein GN956_G10980 [Arapaima gigas]